MARIRPPVKTHGGKFYLCDWIIDNFPSNYEELIYVEVFVGGGSVLLNKKPSVQEIISDKDPKIIAIWKALRYAIDAFSHDLMKREYNLETFEWAKTLLEKRETEGFLDYTETACLEYIVRRMSRGGMRKAFAWSDRLRGGQPGDVNAYQTARDSIWQLSARVEKVEIWNLDFRDVIANWDMQQVLLYLDPPYLKSTRAKGSTEVYSCEMEEKDHKDMLELCRKSDSKIVISGYESKLYNEMLSEWTRVHKDVPNHSGQNAHKTTKREVLWKNF
jgi:DNA adenine methylase